MAKDEEKGLSKSQQNVLSARDAMRQRLEVDNAKTDDDVMEKIADEIRHAETVDDVLQTGDTLEAGEMLDIPLKIESFKLRPSDEQYADTEAFAVINAVVMETGENVVITTGAYNLVNQLVKIDELGGLPIVCAIRQAGRALRLYRVGTRLSVPAAG
jgi:hypothetical protein